MILKIVTLPGDGIGPEVTQQALRVLSAVCQHFGHELQHSSNDIGGAALTSSGEPLNPSIIWNWKERQDY